MLFLLIFALLTLGSGLGHDAMAAMAESSEQGGPLIGKLEGPEVITDPSFRKHTRSVAEYHHRCPWGAGICPLVPLRGARRSFPGDEDVYIMGIVGPGAASGVRVAKLNMANLPARMSISP